MSNNDLRKEVFIKVALSQLANRTAGVLRGSATLDAVVCPAWIKDIQTITEAILSSADAFSETTKLNSGIDMSNYMVPRPTPDTSK
jgi:hypothetical protein